MPTSPSQFLRQQLDLQQLTEREFATRSGLGLSHVYQILRGERKHIRGDTLDKVATGLGMTLADMAIGMGKGDTDIDPAKQERFAIVGLVSDADWPTAKKILLSLAAANAADAGTANQSGRSVNGRSRKAAAPANRVSTRGLVLVKQCFGTVGAWFPRLAPTAPATATA